MGRADIISGGSGGLYLAQFDFGVDRLAARKASLQAAVVSIDDKITAQTGELEQRQAEQITALEELHSAISEYQIAFSAGEDIADEKKRVLKTTEAHALAISATAAAQTELVRLRLNRAAAEKSISELNAVVALEQSETWCTTLTEDATGSVATIEIPGEPTYKLIAPEGRAPTADDGRLLARGAQTGPQAYFNAAILPGWQKWMPDYRTGVIANIDIAVDRCTVTLTDLRSTAQRLNVNQEPVLIDVPIQYLDCNALAFENGDQVVVQFTDRYWNEPTVVGFLSNPKPCGVTGLYSIPANTATIRGWGRPMTDGSGTPINPPLGTPNGTANAVIALCSAEDIDALRRGFATTANDSDPMEYSEQAQQWKEWTSLDGTRVLVCKSDGIYYKNKRRSLNPAGAVHTAAIYTASSVDWLWCCSLVATTLKFWRKLLTASDSADWTLIAEYDLTTLDSRFAMPPWTVVTTLGEYELSPPLVMRAICNGSGTYCLIYVGRPHVPPGYSSPFWHGHLKVETATGAVVAHQTSQIVSDVEIHVTGLLSSVAGPPSGSDLTCTNEITETFVSTRRQTIDVGWKGDDECLVQVWADGSHYSIATLNESERPSDPNEYSFASTMDATASATFYLSVGDDDILLASLSGTRSYSRTGSYDEELGYNVFDVADTVAYSHTQTGLEFVDGPNQIVIAKRFVGSEGPASGAFSGNTFLDLLQGLGTYPIASNSGRAPSVGNVLNYPTFPITGAYDDIDVPFDFTQSQQRILYPNYSWYPWGPPPDTFELEWLAEKWANYRVLNGVLLGSFPVPQMAFTYSTGLIEDRATKVDHSAWVTTSNIEDVESAVYQLPTSAGTRLKNIKLV